MEQTWKTIAMCCAGGTNFESRRVMKRARARWRRWGGGGGGGGVETGASRSVGGKKRRGHGAPWLSRDMFALELASAPINASSSFSERFGDGDAASTGGGSGIGEPGLPPPEFRSKYTVSFAAADYRPPGPAGLLTAQRRLSDQFRTRIWGPPIRGSADPGGPGICAFILTLFSFLLILATFPLSLCFSVKVVQEYERAVIFRLGRLLKGGARGPGIFFIVPCIDTYRKVDLRTVSFDVPPQEVLSRDSVTVSVDAVVYYRVKNPIMATNNVEDYSHSTRLLAATTLRNVLGTKNLAEILSERETISHTMQSSLDEATDPWGVKVERVEIKDVRLPVQLQRAMAAEAEAAREARAKVIAAEGEQKASRALKEAAEVIAESPAALQLRYLQTLNTISAEKNSTIIFPLPIDILKHFLAPDKH